MRIQPFLDSPFTEFVKKDETSVIRIDFVKSLGRISDIDSPFL